MNHDPLAGQIPLALAPPGDPPPRNEDGGSRLVMPDHEHDWAHPRVAVGSGVWDAADVEFVQRVGITHVIDCRATAAGEILYRGTGVQYLHCGTEDDDMPKAPEWFWKGVSFGLHALRKPYAKVLVHCAAGINRGPSMAYALLRAMGLGPTEAERAIKSVRPCARMIYRDCAERAVTAAR